MRVQETFDPTLEGDLWGLEASKNIIKNNNKLDKQEMFSVFVYVYMYNVCEACMYIF